MREKKVYAKIVSRWGGGDWRRMGTKMNTSQDDRSC